MRLSEPSWPVRSHTTVPYEGLPWKRPPFPSWRAICTIRCSHAVLPVHARIRLKNQQVWCSLLPVCSWHLIFMDLGKEPLYIWNMKSNGIRCHQKSSDDTLFINQGMDMATGITPPFPSSYVDAWRIKFSFVYSCWHGYISAWWLYCYAPTNSGCIWYPHPLPTIMWQKCGGKYAE